MTINTELQEKTRQCLPLADTLVVMRTFSMPRRNRPITEARWSTASSPLSSATAWPSFVIFSHSHEAVRFVCHHTAQTGHLSTFYSNTSVLGQFLNQKQQESPADAVKPARRKSMQKMLQFDVFRFISPNSISPNCQCIASRGMFSQALGLYCYTQFEIRCLPIIKFLVQIAST